MGTSCSIIVFSDCRLKPAISFNLFCLKNIIKHIQHYFQQFGRRKTIAWSIVCIVLSCFWFSLPARLFTTPTSFVIEDKNGMLLNASIAADGQWRFPYNEQVPEKFKACIVAFEDKRFNYHFGVDPIALSRAIVQNVKGKKVISGGSTLTMQVIRLSRKQSRTIWQKLVETILAVRLECTYSKKEILALYASNAPFGTNVVGLDAAAWRYFGRSAAQLSWSEMATLAVLPNAPSFVHTGKNRQLLLQKRNRLLDKLVLNKVIDKVTGDLAKIEPLPTAPKQLPQLAPHLLQRFKKDYISKTNPNKFQLTGIKTTIDGSLQQQLTTLINRHHQSLKGNGINNAAAMVVEIESGAILSYVGNIYNTADPEIESHVDILASSRSPGSTLKPLLYTAMQADGLLLPQQLIPDIPTQIGGYTPQNFDLGYDGAVPANKALSRSLNIPAVKMLQQYKYQRFYDVLKKCGFSTLTQPADHYGMSLILGGCEIQPFELAGVYSSMARMYLHQQQNKGLLNVNDWYFPTYEKTKIKKEAIAAPTFDYTSLWHTFNAMNELMRPGEEGLWNMFSSAQRIAWKTGTSFGFRDGWAIGFNTKYCVVVWVGNADGEGRPGLTGINTAAPILFDVFRLLPTAAWFSPPQYDFMYMPTCHKSGYKAADNCEKVDTVLVSSKSKNSSICPWHIKIHIDKTGMYRVNESCESPSEMLHNSWFVLPPAIEYYYKQSHPDYKLLPDYKPGCQTSVNKQMDIIYPDEQAKIYVPLEVSGEKGKTIFTATHRKQQAKIFWHLDDAFLGTTTQFHQMAVNPSIGKHTLTIVDESGETVLRHIEILGKKQ